MPRETLEYKLPFCEKGVFKETTIKICFVSNQVTRMYNELAQDIIELEKVANRKNMINQELAELVIDPDMKIREKMKVAKEKKDEERKLNDILKEKNDKYTFSKRWKIINRILEDNGYEDEGFCRQAFWDEKTEPQTPFEFLSKCVMKDMPDTIGENSKKKSVMNQS